MEFPDRFVDTEHFYRLVFLQKIPLLGIFSNQVNLEFQDAIPGIKTGLCKSIGGVF